MIEPHHIQMIIMFKYDYMDMLFFASHATKFRHSMRNKALYMYYLKSIKYMLRDLTEGLVWMISYCYVLFIFKWFFQQQTLQDTNEWHLLWPVFVIIETTKQQNF
jgi:hypothetical protein